MKVLKSTEYIKENLNIQPMTKERMGKMESPIKDHTNFSGMVFAFKSKNDNDRDSVGYVEIENGLLHLDVSGQIIVHGANYSNRLDDDYDYADYETVLSEKQFNAFKEDNLDQTMNRSIVATLLSSKNERLIEKVKKDELKIIMRECNLTAAEAKETVEDYPLADKYFDHGICYSFKDMDACMENLIDNFGNEEWLVNYLRSNYSGDNDEMEEYFDVAEDNGLSYDTLCQLGYDFNKDLRAEDLNDTYKTLDSGKIIVYNL